MKIRLLNLDPITDDNRLQVLNKLGDDVCVLAASGKPFDSVDGFLNTVEKASKQFRSNTLVLLHLTPFLRNNVSPLDVIEKWNADLSKCFIVFYSGGGIDLDNHLVMVKDTIKVAVRKNLGGLTFLTVPFLNANWTEIKCRLSEFEGTESLPDVTARFRTFATIFSQTDGESVMSENKNRMNQMETLPVLPFGKVLILAESVEKAISIQQQLTSQNRAVVQCQKVIVSRSVSFSNVAMQCADLLSEKSIGSLVVVTHLQSEYLNPIFGERTWEPLIAFLVLTYPEIGWIFCYEDEAEPTSEWSKAHSIMALCDNRYDPIFDGSGLRNWALSLVSKTANLERRFIAPYVPLRERLACAFDDEESYAYFNAYVAYRFGFRAFPVCTDAQARALFYCKEDDVRKLPGPATLTFEDICISYPDGSDEIHYSDLSGEDKSSRKKQLPLLDKADYRIFVTTQHRQVGHPGKNELNQFYIDSGLCVVNGKEPNRYGKLILKPYSGMFDLWRRAKLDRKLLWWDEKGKRFRRGVGQDYVWPPQEQSDTDGDSGHSAPGRLLMIATHMIKRCEKLLPSVKSVQDAVLCAVLATDALELLGNRTPTTAMDALRLKHLAEVTAECQFSGVEYKIEMKARLKELQRDAEHIGRWFDRRRQKMAAMNAEMTTLVDILKVLHEHGQFDEIQICQNRIRYLHNRLWMRQKPIRYFVWPVLVYSEFVLKSFLAFSFAIFVWFIIITGLFYLASTTKSPFFLHLPTAWAQAFKDSLERFITLKEFKGSNTTWWCLVSVFASVLSITHIGLFISHLHLILKRKE
jgi:hypothetical protein